MVLAAEYFKEEIEHIAKGKGVPGLRRIIFPGRFEVLPKEQLRAEVIKAADEIVAMLAGASARQPV